MKILTLFFLLLTLQLKAQDEISGNYGDYFGSSLKISADSTFHYVWGIDLMSSWTNGKWKMIGKIVYLEPILIFDTVRYKDSSTGVLIDTLVLASDESPKLITNLGDFTLQELSTGGQNRYRVPDKLYYKPGKLFAFDKNDKLIKKKRRGFWSKKNILLTLSNKNPHDCCVLRGKQHLEAKNLFTAQSPERSKSTSPG